MGGLGGGDWTGATTNTGAGSGNGGMTAAGGAQVQAPAQDDVNWTEYLN